MILRKMSQFLQLLIVAINHLEEVEEKVVKK